MAKSDLLTWVLAHSPPLLRRGGAKVRLAKESDSALQDDWARCNAVSNATEARAYLNTRVPPITSREVELGMTEYNK